MKVIYKLAEQVLWLAIFAVIMIAAYRSYTTFYPTHWDEVAIKDFNCSSISLAPHCKMEKNWAFIQDAYVGQTVDGKALIVMYKDNNRHSKIFEMIIDPDKIIKVRYDK